MSRGGGLSVILAGVMGLGIGGVLAADEGTPPQSYAQGATRKLGRGMANAATAPLEMIRTPYLVSQRDGGLAGITVGLVQGVWAVAVRELTGVVEAVTFLIPIPADFRPILQPEFIYAHGDWAS